MSKKMKMKIAEEKKEKEKTNLIVTFGVAVAEK
jgi:hypothetical protein